ncbi:uncharacterized protein LOC135839151 [Planococcus citri]|uniref:uncharacterized protein LOC135839151 n=1 Tax=Planococcus citri TaxID=170843 RepID=UPI0031F8D4BB
MSHVKLHKIITKFISKKSRDVSNFKKVFSIFVSIFIVWIGIWKIQTDMKHVFTETSLNSALWLEIIESLDILIFITMVIVVSLENMIKVKNKCDKMEEMNFILNDELDNTGFYTALLFYGALVSIIGFQHLFANKNTDYVQFFLSLSTQYYLLSTELDFINVTIEITSYFRSIHSLLKELLGAPKPLCWIGYEIKRNKVFHIEDCSNLHWIVCKYVDKINQEYSLRLLSLIICIFYKLMFIPYLSSLNLIKAYSENLIKELLHTSLLLFHFAELLVLACSADLTNSEAKKTQYVLCEYAEYHLRDADIDIIETQQTNLCIHKAEFKVFNTFKLNKATVLLVSNG